MKTERLKRNYEKPRVRAIEIQTEQFIATSEIKTYSGDGSFENAVEV